MKKEEIKNIAITDKQFEVLLRAVAVAGSIYGVMSDMVDDKYDKQADETEDVEKLLCGYAYAFGLSNVVEESEDKQVIKMESDWYDDISDDISEYDDYAVYDTLSNKLGWRDFRAKYSEEEIKEMAEERGGYLGVPLYEFENKIYEEFDKYEYSRLFIDDTKKK